MHFFHDAFQWLWDGNAGANIGNVQNAMGIIYSSVSYQGMFNLVTVMPVVAIERLVLYRRAPPPSPTPPPRLTNIYWQSPGHASHLVCVCACTSVLLQAVSHKKVCPGASRCWSSCYRGLPCIPPFLTPHDSISHLKLGPIGVPARGNHLLISHRVSPRYRSLLDQCLSSVSTDQT